MKLRPQKLRIELRISAADIRLGMFIAELDRPWGETPFALQGFLLSTQQHLDMLRDFVREVKIDPSRSDWRALRHLPWDAVHEPFEEPAAPLPTSLRVQLNSSTSATQGNSASALSALRQHLQQLFGGDSSPSKKRAPTPYYLRFDSKTPLGSDNPENARPSSETDRKASLTSQLTPPSTPEFSQLITSLYPRDVHFSPLDWKERWQLWWRRRSAKRSQPRAQAPVKRPESMRPDFLPASMPLVIYYDQTTTAQESLRAQKVVQKAEAILEKIVVDIEADLPISMAEVQPVVDVLVESVVSNPNALMWSARMHEESKKTYLHGLKVAIYMMTLGRHLGFPKEQLTELGSIGLLLDIGMLKLPVEIVDKTEELTPDEHELLSLHVSFSLETLEETEPLPLNIARGIREHHERIDGSGYPFGLTGESISIYGRMAAIADSFAAMTAARSYDVTHSAFDALKRLFKDAESKLHGPLVEQFVQAINIFPVGSLIELSTGEVAIVLEHNPIRRLEPRVLLLTDKSKNLLGQPENLDLMAKNTADDARTKILRGLPDGAYDINYHDYYIN